MPRAKTQQPVTIKQGGRTIEVENAAELLEQLEPDDYELEAAAEELENAQGATVTVYRQGAHGRDWVFIDTIMPSQYTPVMLKHPPYNGGTFRIVMRRADGQIRVNRALSVEPAPKAPEPVGAVSLSGDAGIAILGKAMVEGFGRIGEAMAKIGELIVTNRPVVPEQRGLTDILGDVKALRELVAPVVPSSDPLDVLAKMVGVMKDLPGRDDDAPQRGRATEMDVLLETARAILPQLANAAQSRPQIGHQVDMQDQLTVGAPRPPLRVPQPSPQGQPMQLNPAVLMMNFLVQQAQNANDPEPYAVMVLDNVPPGILDQYMKRDDWFEELCKIAPGAKNFRPWFDTLRGHVVTYLTNDGNSAQNDGASVQGTPSNVTAAPGG